MSKIEQAFDQMFAAIGGIILSFFRHFAPYIVPVAPAFFFGHAMHMAVIAVSPDAVAWAATVAVCAALALEAAGILAAHNVARYYAEGEAVSARVAAAVAVAYLVIGIGGIWLLENAAIDAKIAGTAVFLVAFLIYVLMAQTAQQKRKEVAEAESSLFVMQEKAKDNAARRERKMAALRLEHERKMAALPVETAVSNHVALATVGNRKETAKERVRKLRQEQPEMSQADMARFLNVSPGTVSKALRNGKVNHDNS